MIRVMIDWFKGLWVLIQEQCSVCGYYCLCGYKIDLQEILRNSKEEGYVHSY